MVTVKVAGNSGTGEDIPTLWRYHNDEDLGIRMRHSRIILGCPVGAPAPERLAIAVSGGSTMGAAASWAKQGVAVDGHISTPALAPTFREAREPRKGIQNSFLVITGAFRLSNGDARVVEETAAPAKYRP